MEKWQEKWTICQATGDKRNRTHKNGKTTEKVHGRCAWRGGTKQQNS